MSTLTNTQISNTYKGLLKLDDATTGITSSLQSVQDGLGNDTGLKIATNRLEGSSLFNVYKPTPIGQYYGIGITPSNLTPPANCANRLTTSLFYDNGMLSYSAITVHIGVAAGAPETLEIGFYNAQYLDGYGYAPYQLLTDVVSIPISTSGTKVVSFSGTPLSFSGQGPGVYFAVVKYTTSGGQPVVRPHSSSGNLQTVRELLSGQIGYVFNTTTVGAAQYPYASIGATAMATQIFTQSTFPTTWSSTELATFTAGSSAALVPGFLLHTIR